MDQSISLSTTVIEFHDNANPLLNRENVAQQEMVYVLLYSVVTCFAVLLLLVTIGSAVSVIVLATTTCYRRVAVDRLGPGGRVALPSNSDVELLHRQGGSNSTSTLTIKQVASSNLAVICIAMCFLLAPLEFATAVENYVKHALPSILCFSTMCFFHLLVAALVTSVVVLSMAEFRRLWCLRLKNNKSQDRESGSGIGACVGWSMPWVMGLAAAVTVGVELPQTLEYKVCRSAATLHDSSPPDGQIFPPSSHPMFLLPLGVWLSLIYTAVLILTILPLLVFYLTKRRQLLGYLEARGCRSVSARASPLLGRSAGEDCTASARGEDIDDVDTMAGSTARKSRKSSNASELSHRQVSNDSINSASSSMARRKVTGSPLPTSCGSSSSRAQRTGNEEEGIEDDDDDTFDSKMRLKFQKKQRSNNRRHTVANIGIPDLTAALRRGTFNNSNSSSGRSGPGAGGGSHSGRSNRRNDGGTCSGSSTGGRSPTNYQYVRKWSVDITALANQLENPKAHTGSFPILREHSENLLLSPDFCGVPTGIGRGGRSLPRGRCSIKKPSSLVTDGKDIKKENSPGESVPTVTRSASVKDEPTRRQSVSEDVSPVPSLILAQSPRDGDNPLVTLEEVESIGNVDPPPSIVVSMTTDDEEEPNDNYGNGYPDNELRKSTDNVCGSMRRGNSPSRHSNRCYDNTSLPRDDIMARLDTAWRTMMLLIAALLLLLPYTGVTLLDSLSAGMRNKDLLYNMRLIAEAIVTLQALILPALLIWSDRTLRADVRGCWNDFRQLRCECYCNVGPGRSCSGHRPKRPQHHNKAANANNSVGRPA